MSSADPQSVTPVHKREIFAWTLYDWANSAYSTLLITIVVVYLTQVVMPGTSGQLMYSYGIGITMFVAALLSPVIGAIADARATKSAWFRWTTIPGSLAAGALGLISPESPWLFAALFLVSNVGYELSWGIYNAFLPEIADQKTMNRVSSYGFALGYIGGGLALLTAIIVIRYGDKLGLPDAGPLERDYVMGQEIDFAVQLPEGQYEVTLTMGDLSRAHEKMEISLQEKPVDTVSTAKGEFLARTYPFSVSLPSGQGAGSDKTKVPWHEFSLAVQVASSDPADPAVLNGLEIRGPGLKEPLVFDFGTAASAAADGSYWMTADVEGEWELKDRAWLLKHRQKTPEELKQDQADGKDPKQSAEEAALTGEPLAGPLQQSLYLGFNKFSAGDGRLGSRDSVLVQRLRVCLLIMGVWWTLFSIPALLLLRDRTKPSAEQKSIVQTTADAFEQIGRTLGSVRTYKMLFLFLIAFLIYNDGVQTIITQSSVFAQEVFHIGAGDLVMVVLMIQFVSMPGALFMGWLANKWGEKPTLMLCIGIYIAWLFAAFFIATLQQFWIMGAVLALIMGGIQSVSRAIMGQMTPASRSGEFFGFFNLSGKATSFLGPIVFGSILAWSGQPRLAILSLLPFFLVGGGLAWWIDMAAGRRQAELEG